jgi:hypothetical protein
MTAGISTIRDRTNGRRGCYHQTRSNGLLRAKEYGTGKWFYIKPKNVVLELRPRTLKNKRKESMSFSTEPVRNRHRPGIKTVDTRVYAGPTKIGPHIRGYRGFDVLRAAREYKAAKTGKKYVDGIPATEFA